MYVKCFSFFLGESKWLKEKVWVGMCVLRGVSEYIKIWLVLICLWMFHSMMFVIYLIFYVGRHLDCFQYIAIHTHCWNEYPFTVIFEYRSISLEWIPGNGIWGQEVIHILHLINSLVLLLSKTCKNDIGLDRLSF